MSKPTNNPQLCSLKKSFEKIIDDIICNHIGSDSLLIGLGSGRAVSKFVNCLSDSISKNCDFICTSLQIKIDAEKKGLKVLDETKIPFLDLVIDGADQIDKEFFMLKGGGGALLREKILDYSSKKTIIIGDLSKFVPNFSKPLPVEVLPFGLYCCNSIFNRNGGQTCSPNFRKGLSIFD